MHRLSLAADFEIFKRKNIVVLDANEKERSTEN